MTCPRQQRPFFDQLADVIRARPEFQEDLALLKAYVAAPTAAPFPLERLKRICESADRLAYATESDHIQAALEIVALIEAPVLTAHYDNLPAVAAHIRTNAF